MNHVVFGSGPVGTALVEALVGAGENVSVVNRSGSAEVAPGVSVLGGDASNVDFAKDAARDADVIYQALNPPYDRWPELFPPLQKAVMEAAIAAKAKLVSFENVYLYGPTGGKPLTEETPAAATGPKGRVRAEMARQLLEAHAGGRLRVSIGRASDYFGPRGLISHMGERVFYRVLDSKNAQVFGDPSQPHTYSYIPDIASGLATLGQRDEADGRAWHLPNAPAIPTSDFIAKAYEHAGTTGRAAPMPKPLVSLVSWFNSDVREIREVLHEFEEPFVVDSSAFTAQFDQTATPLDQAIPETVAWFKANPR